MTKIKNIFCADFETSTTQTEFFKKNNDSVVYLGYMKNLRTDEEYRFTNIESFYNIIRRFEKSALIYFHNLSFDGYFLYKYLIEKNIKWYNDIPKKTTGFSVMRNGTKIYKIGFKFYNNKKYITIYFKCSLRILSASIESLGQSFGIQKHQAGDGSEFYNNEPGKQWDEYPTRFLEYTLNDVNVQQKALLSFEQSINKLSLLTKEQNRRMDWTDALTIGGLGFKIQKNYVRNFSYYHYNNADIYNGLKISDKSYKIAQQFYYGGWTQFNPEIQNETFKGEGLAIDINSAHPASMTKLLPYGELYEGDPPPEKTTLIYYEIKVKQALQRFPSVVNLLNWNKRHKSTAADFERFNRYTKIQNKFTCFYFKNEWDILQKFYDFTGAKIVKKYWMHADNFLEKYITDVYSLRLESKKDNNIAMSNCYKILLNSSYGKWATRQIFTEEYITTHADADSLIEMGTVKIKMGEKLKNYKVLGKSQLFSTDDYAVVILEELITKNKNYNKWIAATITAYTRITQWEAILKTDPENFLYGDTDSLYLKKCDLSGIDIHKTRLGAWDIEIEKFAYFHTNGAKVYAIFDENKKPISSKYSGINNRWLKKNISLELYNSQDSTFKDANTRPLYLKSGIAIITKDYTPKQRTL